MIQQLSDVAGIHQALDPQQLGGVDERQEEVRWDGGLSFIHEGEQVLHHVVAQVWDVDDGMGHAARGGPRHIATHEESSEVC